MARLDGKVAIITGAAQGMGAVHAKKFIDEGAKVILTDLNENKGQEIKKLLGDDAIFIKHDVSNEEDWKMVIQKAEEAFGPVHILVNNAGVTNAKSISDTTSEDYMRVVRINQLSVFLGIKTIIPSMEKAGIGSIVNISSLNGLIAGTVCYTDTKFAVRGLTKVAAVELVDKNIRVNSVHPGVTATPMIIQEDTRASVEEFTRMQVPMRRVATPEEVANLVLFVASDESTYSTGSEFVADGGVTSL